MGSDISEGIDMITRGRIGRTAWVLLALGMVMIGMESLAAEAGDEALVFGEGGQRPGLAQGKG